MRQERRYIESRFNNFNSSTEVLQPLKLWYKYKHRISLRTVPFYVKFFIFHQLKSSKAFFYSMAFINTRGVHLKPLKLLSFCLLNVTNFAIKLFNGLSHIPYPVSIIFLSRYPHETFFQYLC